MLLPFHLVVTRRKLGIRVAFLWGRVYGFILHVQHFQSPCTTHKEKCNKQSAFFQYRFFPPVIRTQICKSIRNIGWFLDRNATLDF